MQGTSGVSLIQGFNTEDFSTHFAAQAHTCAASAQAWIGQVSAMPQRMIGLRTDIAIEAGPAMQGTSGVSLIQGFNTEDFSTRFAGEIHGFGCNGYVPKKMERRMDATIKYIMVAGKKVWSDALKIRPSHLQAEKHVCQLDRAIQSRLQKAL